MNQGCVLQDDRRLANARKIEQPWKDCRLKLNGVFLGCVTTENADYIMALQAQQERCEIPPELIDLIRLAQSHMLRTQEADDVSVRLSQWLLARGL